MSRTDQPVIVVVERGRPTQHLLLLGLGETAPIGIVMRRQERIGSRDGGGDSRTIGTTLDIEPVWRDDLRRRAQCIAPLLMRYLLSWGPTQVGFAGS